MAYVEEKEIPPPSTMTVDHERRPILYLPDGKVLVRVPGFAGTIIKSSSSA